MMSGRQTKKESLIESVTNTIVGGIISATTTHYLAPILGFTISITENIHLVIILTLVSSARTYTVRRLFSKYVGRNKRKGK